MLQLSPRQVHLDFHTSEAIPGIAENFNAQEFAKKVKSAHISSMTVFARCHHGWLYYDSQVFPELIHPNLSNRNLLIEQINALHAQGIRAPVYLTVQWDYHSAQTHPEWLVRKADGSHEGDSFTKAGFYQSLCVNTDYRDFLKAQIQEICELLQGNLDGFFFDIVGIRPCLCATCRAMMKARGISITEERAVRAFAKESIDAFKADITKFIRRFSKDCTVFYNAGHIGPGTKSSNDAYTHYELESLPSGVWGYLHFSAAARYARTLGKDCLGMTGKFHTEWGDFHSLKNQAALEYECMRMLSHGFAASIGDQLEPCGTLQSATYDLIGAVYKQYERYEEYARPSIPVAEAAVLTAEDCLTEFAIPESIFGATQLLEELAIQFDIIDEDRDFSLYSLLFIPEDFVGSRAFAAKLERFVKNGGHVIAFGKGGQLPDKTYLPCYGAICTEMRGKTPDFLLANGVLSQGLSPDTEYVIYKQGVVIQPTTAKTVMTARAPYFARSGEHFCSHQYTPSAHGETYPAVVQNNNVLLFSHPLFTQYRENAPLWVKKIVKNAILYLLGNTMISHNGPSTLSANLLHQPEKNRYTLHLLSYIPVRKCATIDIIEERTPVYDIMVKLHLPNQIKKAFWNEKHIEITVEDNCVKIPKIDGYDVVIFEY